jgi:hypothetical protein
MTQTRKPKLHIELQLWKPRDKKFQQLNFGNTVSFQNLGEGSESLFCRIYSGYSADYKFFRLFPNSWPKNLGAVYTHSCGLYTRKYGNLAHDRVQWWALMTINWAVWEQSIL